MSQFPSRSEWNAMRGCCPHASVSSRMASARTNADVFRNPLLFQHPEVLAAPTLAGVHNKAASTEGDAAECSGDRVLLP
jgi:hypothetical protein